MGEGTGGGEMMAPVPPILAFIRGEGTFTHPYQPAREEELQERTAHVILRALAQTSDSYPRF
jgi:hypothetical protein